MLLQDALSSIMVEEKLSIITFSIPINITELVIEALGSFLTSIVHKPPVLVAHGVLILYDPHKVTSIQGQVHQICR